MTAFPSNPYDGEIYSIGPRSWTWSASQQGWLLNYTGPTGPSGPTGPQGVPGVLLTSLTVDSFSGDGLTTSFLLSVVPQSIFNTLVNIDGLVQTANTNYTINGQSITFATAPIENSTIDVTTFLTGAPVTGPIGIQGPTGPTGYSTARAVVISSTGSNSSFYPTWASSTNGNLPLYASTNFAYNPSNVTVFTSGNLSVQNSISSGNLGITNTTPAINSSSGALIVGGGAGINGNIYAANDVVASGNVISVNGYFQTSASTSYVVDKTSTTVYIAGNATNATIIGNNTGIVQLNGNVQGSTNGYIIGYRDIPQIIFNSDTNITISDAGKHYYSIESSNLTLTISNNTTVPFSIGTFIKVINRGSGTINLAPDNGVTLYLAGSSTPGTRSLSSYGTATILKVETDIWIIEGVGLT